MNIIINNNCLILRFSQFASALRSATENVGDLIQLFLNKLTQYVYVFRDELEVVFIFFLSISWHCFTDCDSAFYSHTCIFRTCVV